MIFIVIPAYNEEKNIEATVRAVLAANPAYRVVVVDDGSSDETAELARRAGAMVLRHELNRGQGAALQTGALFSLAQGAEIIAHFDADGQFEASEIAPLVEPIERGEVDVVLGSRFLITQSTTTYNLKPKTYTLHSIPWTKKYLLLPLARIFNFFLTGAWLTDAHNGFRAFSARAVRLVTIEEDRMAHGTEILEKMVRLGLKFKEMPVTVRYHRYGQSWVGGLTIIKELIFGKLL